MTLGRNHLIRTSVSIEKAAKAQCSRVGHPFRLSVQTEMISRGMIVSQERACSRRMLGS